MKYKRRNTVTPRLPTHKSSVGLLVFSLEGPRRYPPLEALAAFRLIGSVPQLCTVERFSGRTVPVDGTTAPPDRLLPCCPSLRSLRVDVRVEGPGGRQHPLFHILAR